jgi:Domain of unknown function (DUF4177)
VPYYVNTAELTVEVIAPGKPPPPNCTVIDGDTVGRLVDDLVHGMSVTSGQVAALIEGDVAAFLAELSPSAAIDRQMERERIEKSPPLPQVGKWEYKVIPMTEFAGFGTAKGSAERMQAALNDFAAHGWELVTTSERDSRWMGGETVLMTLRRFVVSEHMFAERVRAEERVRRQVIAELDGAEASLLTGH